MSDRLEPPPSRDRNGIRDVSFVVRKTDVWANFGGEATPTMPTKDAAYAQRHEQAQGQLRPLSKAWLRKAAAQKLSSA